VSLTIKDHYYPFGHVPVSGVKKVFSLIGRIREHVSIGRFKLILRLIRVIREHVPIG